jgi:cation diffusion facilitator CzcD-associated flavoprotein CzcO
MKATPKTLLDVIVIGGGQAGLATAYFLRRTGLSYLILDAEDGPGGTAGTRCGCSLPPPGVPSPAG